ncbi:MAG: GumC family protein [Tepidisphaeraceae bacterium]
MEIIWRRRRVVAAFTAICLLIAGTYLVFAKPIYTANSRLYVERGGQGLLASRVDRDTTDNSSFLFTQREVVASTPVLAVALGKPGMLDLKTFAGQSSAFAYLKNNLDVEVGKKDELITVSFDSPYPDEATKIVAAVVDAYRWFQSSQRTVSASGAAATLKNEKHKAEAELADKTKAMQAFAEQHDIVGTADGRNTLGAQTLASLAASITAAHLETLNARARLDDLKHSTAGGEVHDTLPADGSLINAAEDQATIRQELLQAQATLQTLTRQFLPQHPLVQAAQKRVEALTAANNAAIQAYYDAAAMREADLKNFYAAEQRRLVEQDAYSAEYTRMGAEVSRIEKLIDSLDNRIRELDVTDDGAMATVSVLEPARAEDHPTGPKKVRTLAFGLLAGLMLGALAACVSDHLDTRLTSASEIKHHLGLPTMAIMPTMPTGLSPVARALQVYHEPESPLADACRALRTTILFGASNHRVKTILLASPSNGDGRTTIASNLAISLAQVGRKVLLIDADLRSPMQDWIYGIKGDRGLSNILMAGSFNPAHVAGNVQDTLVPNLQVMPSGGKTSNPAEMFNSKALMDLLDWVADAYDHVIIDTPPSRAHTDARIIASSCDVTLMVLCLGKHNRNVAAQTRDDLMNVGANVLGVVLNQAPSPINSSSRDVNDWKALDAADSRGRELVAARADARGVAQQVNLASARPLL